MARPCAQFSCCGSFYVVGSAAVGELFRYARAYKSTYDLAPNYFAKYFYYLERFLDYEIDF